MSHEKPNRPEHEAQGFRRGYAAARKGVPIEGRSETLPSWNRGYETARFDRAMNGEGYRAHNLKIGRKEPSMSHVLMTVAGAIPIPRWSDLPHPMRRDVIERWLVDGIWDGSKFESAILAADLIGAVRSAEDEESRANIAAIVNWLSRETPGGSWGSSKRMLSWADLGASRAT
jgi:hypothetical protein